MVTRRAFFWPASLLAADWPQFLGPRRDGASDETIEPWKSAPVRLWQKDVGPGFAGPVVAQGKLLLFHRLAGSEVLEAFEPLTGKKLWSSGYLTNYRDDFGFDEGPRSAPVAAGGRVFTFGAESVLQAVDLATGKRIWSVPAMANYAAPKGFFGAAGSPLVVNDIVLINLGGRNGAGVIAFDAASGKERWKSSNDGASYSSGTAATFAGVQAAVFLTREGLLVLEAATGKILRQLRWRSRSQASVNAATPLVWNNQVFISSSYATGAALVPLDAASPPVWASDDAMSNHYATCVRAGEFLYGYHGRQEEGPALRCVEWKTGKVRWSEERFGAGSILLAGTRLLILRESGELLLADASPNAFQPLARARLFDSLVRAYPALSDGLFFARGESSLRAWRLKT